MTHDQALARAMLAVTKAGGRVFRHEVGLVTDMRGHKHMIGTKGEPDLMGVAPDGRALAIEVKTNRASRTKEQFAFARMWMRHQGLYVLARYSDEVDGDKIIAAALDGGRDGPDQRRASRYKDGEDGDATGTSRRAPGRPLPPPKR